MAPIILLERAPFLILDEPTNHLDFQTVEALTQALVQYEGTLIVVSHDRSFVQRVATKILEIRGGHVETFPGTYDDYVWSCQKGVLSERNQTASLASDTKASFGNVSLTTAPRKFERSRSGEEQALGAGPHSLEEKFNFKEAKKQLERDLRKTEKDLKAAEAAMSQLQEQIQSLNQKLIHQPGDPETWKWIQEISAAALENSKLEESWLELSERVEALGTAIREMKGEA